MEKGWGSVTQLVGHSSGKGRFNWRSRRFVYLLAVFS